MARQSVFDIFESATCGRCGGEGRLFQHSNVLGGACFKCHGVKRVLTTQGKRDYDAWRAAVDLVTLRPITDVQPGMSVKLEGFAKYYLVVSVSEPYENGGYYEAGALVPTFYVDITFDRIVPKDCGPCGVDRSVTHRSPVVDVSTAPYGPEMVQIHAGEAMPRAEAFVTHRCAEVSA